MKKTNNGSTTTANDIGSATKKRIKDFLRNAGATASVIHIKIRVMVNGFSQITIRMELAYLNYEQQKRWFSHPRFWV